jgi:large subunit ribosomal protein L32
MRRDRRRSANFKLKGVNVTKCPKCQEPVLSHRVCPSCGTYKGAQVLDAT